MSYCSTYSLAEILTVYSLNAGTYDPIVISRALNPEDDCRIVDKVKTLQPDESIGLMIRSTRSTFALLALVFVSPL